MSVVTYLIVDDLLMIIYVAITIGLIQLKGLLYLKVKVIILLLCKTIAAHKTCITTNELQILLQANDFLKKVLHHWYNYSKI